MKLPRRIRRLLDKKELTIDELRLSLEKQVIRLQSSLFEEAVANIIPRLDVKNGVLQDSVHNYKLISEIESLYAAFNAKVFSVLIPKINKGLESIAEINRDLFLVSLADDMPMKFDKILASTKELIDLRIGLRAGKVVRGSFIESAMSSSPVDFQQYMSKAVTGQESMRDFILGIREKITGGKAKTGLTERQFQRYVYDIYQQYDRAYNKKLAEEFGMVYFVYQGNLIKDSRDFCAAHYNKVWSIDETEDWSQWTPARGIKNDEFPAGYVVKAKDLYSVPSYMGYAGYDPIIDFGGFNCRHIYAPISNDLAYKLRPDLKK